MSCAECRAGSVQMLALSLHRTRYHYPADSHACSGPALRIMRIANTVASLTLAAVAAFAHAACRNEFEVCAAGSPWSKATAATVRMEFAGTNASALLAFSFPSPNNVVIDREHHEQDKTTIGKVLLVDGRVMLTKDLELENGREIYAMDGPLLIYQLAVSLLATGFPEGPEEIRRKSIVNFEEQKRGISVETSSATGFFGAPWRVQGTVDPISTQSFAYTFEFEFSADGSRRELALSGIWRSDPTPAPDPGLTLKDWHAFTLVPKTITRGGTRMLGFEAKPTAEVPTTLGELRNSLRTNAR